MNTQLLSGIAIAMLLLNCSVPGLAQWKLNQFDWGLSGGMAVYQGDLTPSPAGSYRTAKPALSVMAIRPLNERFGLRTIASFARLQGNDALYHQPEYRQHRNFNFTASIFELSAQIVWSVLPNKKFTPYAFAGPGISFTKIQRDASGFNAEYFANEPQVQEGLASDLGRNTPRILPVLPMGMGLRYQLTEKISLFAESSYRLTGTDYLDGFSKAANSNRKDHYQTHMLGIIFRPGKKTGLDCPPNNQ
jgi:hypothetical protein